MNYVLLLGRILFSIVFLWMFPMHFSEKAMGYAAAHGMPFPGLLMPLWGIIGLLGALSIILGYKARIGGWLIAIAMLPATFMMHKFWSVSDPMAAMMQKALFLKNLSLLGAGLIIAYFGSGPMSLSKK